MKEHALLLGAEKSLVGIYTPAETGRADNKPAARACLAIFLNAGLTHHVGPHRLHVKLARELSSQGISSLRLDLSGIGDSATSTSNNSAQELAKLELKEVMDELEQRGYSDIILFGICSGGKLALQTAPEDKRIKGIIVINQSLAADDPELAAQIAADYYVKSSLWRLQAWLNLFTGRVNYKRLWSSLVNRFTIKNRSNTSKKTSLAELIHDEIKPVLDKNTHILMLFSDQHAKFINMQDDKLKPLQTSELLEVQSFPEADHLFTRLDEQQTLIKLVCHWSQCLTD